MKKPLLEVHDLKTHFYVEGGAVHAVNGVSFDLGEGEVLGIVGESGCGKSVAALSLMRLIEEPGRIIGGEALLYDGQTVVDVLALGYQLIEAVKLHQRMSNDDARKHVVGLLARVGIPDPERRLRDYPHQF